MNLFDYIRELREKNKGLNMNKINEEGLKLIKDSEGLRLEAYKCAANVTTIGYGTTIYPFSRQVKMGDTCTEEEAELYLRHDVGQFEDAVKDLIKVSLNQNQFSALVSFTYNLGAGNLKKSTLRQRLNEGDYNVGNEFLKWNKAGGKVLNGLTISLLSNFVLLKLIECYSNFYVIIR